MNSKNRNLGSRFIQRLGFASALSALMAIPALAQDSGRAVEVTDYGTVTLAVQDTDLAQVLEMLSIQSQKNIITSKNVSATISANLYDVTFYEALDSILKVNGYNYIEQGNFIYIYTQAEMDELDEANRRTEARTFNLNNLSATDANELIAPLLSENGRSSFRGDVQPGIEPDTSDAGGDDWAFTAMLVVNDYPENLEEIASLLASLDRAPKQVLIESTILQTTLDEQNGWGVDFSVIGDVDFNDFTSPLSGVVNLLAGANDAIGFQPDDNRALVGTSTVGGAQGPGGFKLGIVSNDISVFLRVLDEVTDSTVLARPKIMCLNRQRAEVLVGARVGYLSTTATETTTTQTVEFLDTGIHLMFRPFISDNGMIRLELAPSVSEASLRTVTDSNGLSVTIPDELTNEITTNVRVRDGQTLVLGGLFRESNRVSRRQIPYLGDIPIIGAAFTGQDDTVDRDEIIFLITPSIVSDDALWAMGDEGMDFSNQMLVGARRGLLPFSRSKMTANYNHEAMASYKAGDLEKALYAANNSLRLDPDQPEVIRLREKITGVKEQAHERSLMERIFIEEFGTVAFPESGTSMESSDSYHAESTSDRNANEWNWSSDEHDGVNAEMTDDSVGFDTDAASETTEDAFAAADDYGSEMAWSGDDADTQTAWSGDDVDTQTAWNEGDGASFGDVESFDDAGTAAAETESFASSFDEFGTAQPETSEEMFEPQVPARKPSRLVDESASWSTDVESAPESFESWNDAAADDALAFGSDVEPAFESGDFRSDDFESAPYDSSLVADLITAAIASGAEEEWFIDRFIHEYFTALGLAHLSPYFESPLASEWADETFPFVTFDEIEEMIEIPTEFVEAENEDAPLD